MYLQSVLCYVYSLPHPPSPISPDLSEDSTATTSASDGSADVWMVVGILLGVLVVVVIVVILNVMVTRRFAVARATPRGAPCTLIPQKPVILAPVTM